MIFERRPQVTLFDEFDVGNNKNFKKHAKIMLNLGLFGVIPLCNTYE